MTSAADPRNPTVASPGLHIAIAIAAAVAVAVLTASSVLEGFAFAAFGLVMVWIVSADLRQQPITEFDILRSGAVAAALLVASTIASDGASPLPRAFAAGVAMAAVLTLFHVLYPAGFGRRNIVLGALVAIFVGSISWTAVWVTFASASVFAGVATGYLVLRKKQSPGLLLPTSPFFAASAFIAVALLG